MKKMFLLSMSVAMLLATQSCKKEIARQSRLMDSVESALKWETSSVTVANGTAKIKRSGRNRQRVITRCRRFLSYASQLSSGLPKWP